jgi:hypothetical protein
VARPDWTRKLPRQITVAGVIKLTTLDDIRDLIDRHLPKEFKNKDTWRHVGAELGKAARGADLTSVVASLRIVLSLEGVTCDMK